MLKRASVLLAGGIALSACTSAPIENLHDQPVPGKPNGTALNLKQVRASVMAGCVDKGWTPRLVKPDEVDARIQVRDHSAEVLIPFSAGSYSIVYKNSSNLDYDGKRIHHNYNRWVSYRPMRFARK